MRRIIPVLLIVLLVPLGYYMASSGGNGSKGSQNLQDSEGIVLELGKSVYSTKDVMTLTVVNNAKTNVTTGYHFRLYKLENGEWKELKLDLMFVEIAVVIKPGGSWEQRIDLSRLNLEPGHYRITKRVSLDSPAGNAISKEVGAEFDVRA
ncbi:immunoglobulin-like domain-containing protein [Thermococcus celer]|uniref:Bacterial Ig-like domain-containing protein n=1 Tax=Thermococcus celer Vu 13 = JCM 8558 TaxID=1293037 RepID=A0A218P282_THECE|nr:immunoglobulin-like domain-containing protein [Thermococcus celer]ASI99023.1 hypothetical protein A3L02_05315 [Thermococcus celer Vu 13 = JCM 8558]